jgi:hypothetical protein
MSSLAKDTQWVDAVDQAELVRSGKVTPVELLDAAIERAEQLNPAINALTYTWLSWSADENPTSPATNTNLSPITTSRGPEHASNAACAVSTVHVAPSSAEAKTSPKNERGETGVV